MGFRMNLVRRIGIVHANIPSKFRRNDKLRKHRSVRTRGHVAINVPVRRRAIKIISSHRPSGRVTISEIIVHKIEIARIFLHGIGANHVDRAAVVQNLHMVQNSVICDFRVTNIDHFSESIWLQAPFPTAGNT